MPQDPILSEDDQDGDEVVGEASVFTQSLIQQKLYEKVKSTENKARRRKKKSTVLLKNQIVICHGRH